LSREYPSTVSSISMLTNIRGIYVPDDDRWPAKFRGIGIRIEDSVCVGDDNPIVLTTEAVKEVSSLMATVSFKSRQRC
jgi:Xaa-Pro aminopeptidase